MHQIYVPIFLVQACFAFLMCSCFNVYQRLGICERQMNFAKFSSLTPYTCEADRRSIRYKLNNYRQNVRRNHIFLLSSCVENRQIIIGDVHGCRDELLLLLDKCKFDHQRDRIIFVGDLVAKGPDSLGCLKLASSLNASSVIGNHEVKVLKFVKQLASGTAAVENSEHAILANSLLKKHIELLDYVRKFPPWIELHDSSVLVVHAGLLPGTRPDENDLSVLTTMRSITEQEGMLKSSPLPGKQPWALSWRGPPTVIFGHDAARGLQVVAERSRSSSYSIFQNRFYYCISSGLPESTGDRHRLRLWWKADRRCSTRKATCVRGGISRILSCYSTEVLIYGYVLGF